MKHHFENHDLVTGRRTQLIDLTDDLINEDEPVIADDFADTLEQLAPASGSYRHDDREEEHSPNGHSHVLAGVLASSSQTIPIVDGTLRLGRYQRVFFCELDCSRARKVFIQVIGE
jgi:secondary thiamine-phosphate synthase enzyme